ncbi:hypothetical protein LSUE1_G006172 [Lachnellula suecica]|uniref:Uncharacterized protein n=1 Tax=Lachnellula suecica TaxID=602035 RepID=A0A8T9BZ97_9HELO|nr:hypothetical protein LSUE1_G006172 [Lachnellula suecica]
MQNLSRQITIEDEALTNKLQTLLCQASSALFFPKATILEFVYLLRQTPQIAEMNHNGAEGLELGGSLSQCPPIVTSPPLMRHERKNFQRAVECCPQNPMGLVSGRMTYRTN